MARRRGKVSRRTVLGTGLGLAGAAAASPPVGGAPSPERGEVIDFRVRPPFRRFRNALYRGRDPDASDEALMEDFIADMRAAGIVRAVAMGRFAPAEGAMQGHIPNGDVAALVARYPQYFVGFGSVDVRAPKRALDEIDRCVQLGFRGIAFDNPLSTPPLYDDDRSLMRIYEHCARRNLIVSLTSSIMVGPDLTYSMPVHIQRVGLAFPEMPIVVPHAAWPWTTHMIGVALQGVMFKVSNVYLMPDFYLNQTHAPGRQDYVDAANFGLDGRILFASSYPALPLRESVEVVRSIPFRSPEALPRILWKNAAHLLARLPD